MYKFFICIFVCFFFCCCQTENIQSSSDYLKFYYWDKNIDTEYSITSFEDVRNDELCADTVFYDTVIIKQFYNYLIELKTSSNQRPADLRVTSELHYNDTTIIASFGEKIGIMLNGVRMEDDKRLFNFIEKNLYSKDGYRRLFDKQMESEGVSTHLSPEQIEEHWQHYYSTLKK